MGITLSGKMKNVFAAVPGLSKSMGEVTGQGNDQRVVSASPLQQRVGDRPNHNRGRKIRDETQLTLSKNNLLFTIVRIYRRPRIIQNSLMIFILHNRIDSSNNNSQSRQRGQGVSA